jgi:hypothetical protein
LEYRKDQQKYITPTTLLEWAHKMRTRVPAGAGVGLTRVSGEEQGWMLKLGDVAVDTEGVEEHMEEAGEMPVIQTNWVVGMTALAGAWYMPMFLNARSCYWAEYAYEEGVEKQVKKLESREQLFCVKLRRAKQQAAGAIWLRAGGDWEERWIEEAALGEWGGGRGHKWIRRFRTGQECQSNEEAAKRAAESSSSDDDELQLLSEEQVSKLGAKTRGTQEEAEDRSRNMGDERMKQLKRERTEEQREEPAKRVADSSTRDDPEQQPFVAK